MKFRQRKLNHPRERPLTTAGDIKERVQELSTLLTALTEAWNRELAPFLRAVEITLGRVAAHTVSLVDTDVELNVDTSLLLVDATSGAITITLPDPATAWRQMAVKKYDATANTVTVDGNGASVDGVSAKVITTQYETLTVISDGSNYWVV